PHYCPTTNLCYATEEKAAAACGSSGCFRCVAPVTGTCPSAPTGGSCNGTSGPSYYCGTAGCCGSANPYFCPAKNLCYQTSNQAFAACAGDACIACAAPCSEPPNVTSSEISDGICGGQPLAMIDGIPAFAMCDAALNSNVWSSTGGDTASVSEGPGWVETGVGRISGKNGYQCTELAMRYFYFRFGICPWIAVPAKDMCSETVPSTVVLTTTPVHGDLVILPPGCNGAGQESGHVAVVNTVSGSSVTVVQQNAGVNGTATFHTDCATCFIHAVANQ
ncbi:MAG TPA: CHAP domain-containing protein, partial [Polyangia bacterium]